MSDLEAILRKSLEERRAKPFKAVDELKAIVVDMSAAVTNVTKGRVKVLLDPLPPKGTHGPTFALVLRLPDEERVLRVLAFAELGYPVKIWTSYESWDSAQMSYGAAGLTELKTHLESMLSNSKSELVRIIDNQLAVMQDESGTLAGSASG